MIKRYTWKLKRLNRIDELLAEEIGEEAVADLKLLRELGDFYDEYPDSFDWDVAYERKAIARLIYEVVELELAEQKILRTRRLSWEYWLQVLLMLAITLIMFLLFGTNH